MPGPHDTEGSFAVGDPQGEEWLGGRLIRLQVDGHPACVIVPAGEVDEHRRWLWFSPGWMPVRISLFHDWPGRLAEHEFYVSEALSRGFHVAGVECTVSCGSPVAISAYQRLYETVTSEYGLNSRARVLCQSNGGLMTYNWATRHPGSVDRIVGLFPATDLRSWPGLGRACDPEFTHGNGYEMTPAQLGARLGEFNPIEQLESLASHGVMILHLHGDQDRTVPLEPNSAEFASRYREYGGDLELVIERGAGHKRNPVFYESARAVEFLFA